MSRLEQLGREIEVLVEKLDKVGGKAVDYRDTIDQLLEEANKLCDDNAAFEVFKDQHCPKLKRSRTYELLAVEQGHKTIEDIRAATRLRVAKHRAAKKTDDVTESDSVTRKPSTLPLAIQKQAEDVTAKLPASWETAEESAEKRRAEYAAAEQPEAQNDSDDYVPQRSITKAELMAALETILWCRIKPREEYDSDVADIKDPDIELFDALSEAEEIIGGLLYQIRLDDSVWKALEERTRAEKEMRKAQSKRRRQKPVPQQSVVPFRMGQA